MAKNGGDFTKVDLININKYVGFKSKSLFVTLAKAQGSLRIFKQSRRNGRINFSLIYIYLDRGKGEVVIKSDLLDGDDSVTLQQNDLLEVKIPKAHRKKPAVESYAGDNEDMKTSEYRVNRFQVDDENLPKNYLSRDRSIGMIEYDI